MRPAEYLVDLLMNSYSRRDPYKQKEQWPNSGNTLARLLLISLLSAVPVLGHTNPQLEQIKAGYLFNFLKFIQWKSEQTEPNQALVIGILGTVAVQSSSTFTSIVISLVGAGSELVPDAELQPNSLIGNTD